MLNKCIYWIFTLYGSVSKVSYQCRGVSWRALGAPAPGVTKGVPKKGKVKKREKKKERKKREKEGYKKGKIDR